MLRLPGNRPGRAGRPVQNIILTTIIAQLTRMVMRALFRR